MEDIKVGPFVIKYLQPTTHPHTGAEMDAFWYTNEGVRVTGRTPEECVMRIHAHICRTIEELSGHADTLEDWLQDGRP